MVRCAIFASLHRSLRDIVVTACSLIIKSIFSALFASHVPIAFERMQSDNLYVLGGFDSGSLAAGIRGSILGYPRSSHCQ